MARTTIGSMAAYVTADTTSFSTGLNSASKKVSGFSAGVSSSLKKVGAAFVALGAIAAGGKFLGSFFDNLQRIDEVSKVAERIGTTTEALSRLQFAAGQSGVESETLTKSMQLFGRGLVEATQGTGTAVDALDRLGLSAAELVNMPLTDALGVVADAMLGIENPTEKVALAMDLFGARGAGLINVLAGGSKGLAEFASEADRLNITVGTESAKRAEAFNDAIDRLKGAFTGVLNALTPLLPTLEKFIDLTAGAVAFVGNLTESLSKVPSAIGKWFTEDFLGLPSAAKTAAEAVESITPPLIDVETLVEQIESTTDSLAESVEAVADPLEEAWQSTRQWADAFDDAREAAARIFDETRTDSERLAMKIAEINQLFRDGHLDIETYNRAIRNASIRPDESVSRLDTRRVTREADFAALGAAGATGRKTDAMLKAEQDQLAEAKASRRIQEETLKAIRANPKDALQLVNF